MSTISRIVMMLACLVCLSGCVTSQLAEPIDRPNLEVNIPEPLEPRNVTWKVFTYNGVTYFALTSKDYENLSKNVEDVQNRLWLFHNIIKQQQEYYRADN